MHTAQHKQIVDPFGECILAAEMCVANTIPPARYAK